MANEKRLIYLDNLEAQFHKTKMIEVFPNWKELPPNVTSAIIRFARKWRTIILNAPTVDAVEVVHGKWIELPSMAPEYACSQCGQSYEWWEVSEAHYCPNCGAKMDGVGNA